MKLTLACLLLLFVSESWASIPELYVQVSAEKQVPAALLYAIALQESRPSPDQVIGVVKPWPWTLNCSGKSYFFSAKALAVQFAEKVIADGRNCDIGLMQMSWKWHAARFHSIESAFDPLTNLRAGADYLFELYQRSGSWEYAVGGYHNLSDQNRASTYRNLVLKHFLKVVSL